MRFSIGSACHLRINSRIARSLSRATASRRFLRLGALLKSGLQYFEYGEIARPPGGAFTLDDIRQRCHEDGHA